MNTAEQRTPYDPASRPADWITTVTSMQTAATATAYDTIFMAIFMAGFRAL